MSDHNLGVALSGLQFLLIPLVWVLFIRIGSRLDLWLQERKAVDPHRGGEDHTSV